MRISASLFTVWALLVATPALGQKLSQPPPSALPPAPPLAPVAPAAVISAPAVPPPPPAAAASGSGSGPAANLTSNPWPATPPSAAASSTSVVDFVNARAELGCDYRSHVVTQHQVLVACGAAGIVVLAPQSASYLIVERRPTGVGAAVGFFEQNGAIWVRVVDEHAVQIASGKILGMSGADVSTPPPASAPVIPPAAIPSAAPAAGPLAAAGVAAKPAVTGRVLQVKDRLATVNLGRDDGLKLGDRVAFYEDSGNEAELEEYELAGKAPVVGVVADAGPNVSRVRLGFHEEVSVGAHASATNAPSTASRTSPPRVIGVWDLSALIRPGLSLGAAGGILEAELQAGRRARNWYFGGTIAPLGIAGASGSKLIKFGAAHVFGAFDGQAFGAGIGLGITGVNDTGGLAPGGTGLGVHELLRIGAVDGLNLTIRTALAVFRSEIDFANVDIQGQVAVAPNAWLLLRGGGGVVGYGFGEVAVRALTTGNGGAGSSFLEVGLGGSGSWEDTCPFLDSVVSSVDFSRCSSTEVAGPHLSVGMDWRL